VGSGDRYMRCYTLGMDTPDASVTDASVPDASVTVYTDGACRGNPGRGGWAWAVPGGPYASGADPATTNQRMEIKAALEALRYWRTQPVSEIDVVSDSTYVVNCFRDRWWQGWQRRGWLNSQKKPVANRDLWEPLIELAVGSEARVTWRWVKGHSGDRWNDRVDELATAAADSGHGDSDLR
jgi:ribonuclease HI